MFNQERKNKAKRIDDETGRMGGSALLAYSKLQQNKNLIKSDNVFNDIETIMRNHNHKGV